jgi:oxalate decarboxylase/phosphoglucose isomerase-like protein (cupin superfamily)
MTGYVIGQKDVQLFANGDRSEHFRSTLNKEIMPIEGITGGWYFLAAGAGNHLDVHEVDEIYFITEGSAMIFLDGEERRMQAGDTVLVPRGCEHRIDNDGTEELALVYLFCPPPAPRTDSSTPSPYRPVDESPG